MKTASWLPGRNTRTDIAWLLGFGLMLLAITITVTLITVRLERPAAAVTQTSCTVTTAHTVRR